jgi:hypothetical protein
VTVTNTLQRELRNAWRASPALTAVGLAMLLVLAGTLVGLVADPRLVGGAPAWLKPAKFAISTALYSLTIAWILSFLDAWPRTTRIVARTTAIVLVLEVTLIALQAARGTTSHFNVATPFDATVFSVMGVAIVVQWVTSLALAVAVFRQSFPDRALGRAIRFGVLISVLGSAVGGLMVRPTSAQRADMQAAHRPTVVGAHTVGAPDGAPGLPGTGWSRDHGDLRVPHFLGLHALQILPALALLLQSTRPRAWRDRIIVVAAASYAALFVILLAQALIGQSLIAPQGAVLLALLLWSAGTAIGLVTASAAGRTIAASTRKKVTVV